MTLVNACYVLEFGNQKFGGSGKPYVKCPKCEKELADPSSLYRHKKIHDGNKPHMCLLCDKTFIQRYNMRQHLGTHAPHPQKASVILRLEEDLREFFLGRMANLPKNDIEHDAAAYIGLVADWTKFRALAKAKAEKDEAEGKSGKGNAKRRLSGEDDPMGEREEGEEAGEEEEEEEEETQAEPEDLSPSNPPPNYFQQQPPPAPQLIAPTLPVQLQLPSHAHAFHHQQVMHFLQMQQQQEQQKQKRQHSL